MTSRIFVTATGTEIGKTYLSAAIVTAACRINHSVHALKPLMSGFAPDAYGASDAGILLSALGEKVTPETVSDICLHAFPPPLAPNVAARQLGVEIDDEALLDFCRRGLKTDAGLILVEGAGGVLSPATDDMLQADLIAALDLPAILVTTNYLGAVSHTLTALESLERRQIPVAAMVVSQPTPDAATPTSLIDELLRLRPEIAILAAPFGIDPNQLGDDVLSVLNPKK